MSTAILEKLPVQIFADGADREGIIELYRKPYIKGLTTNPTLMRKVGITDYEAFAKSILETVTTSRSRLRFSPMNSRKCDVRLSRSRIGRKTFT